MQGMGQGVKAAPVFPSHGHFLVSLLEDERQLEPLAAGGRVAAWMFVFW